MIIMSGTHEQVLPLIGDHCRNEDIQMKKMLRILRQESTESEKYWETYLYETDLDTATVAQALSEITEEDLVEQDQTRPFRPLVWEHSCLQKKCGACAMVINHRPCLACDTRLADCSGETVLIEPMKKFPVIEDLLVDRSVMMNTLKELSVWFEDEAGQGGEKMAFEASKCLQCGLCLEVCPNFYAGGAFGGMAAMAPLSRLIAKLPESQRKKISTSYTRGVYEGCGKSLACQRICPASIDMEKLLARSSAAAIWRRWKSADRY